VFRYRLSPEARADITDILDASERLHGTDARGRYLGLLVAALRRVAATPMGRATAARDAIEPGLRSLHIRHCRTESREAQVHAPVHVLYYRVVDAENVQIVRVMHERMDFSRHMEGD
jgi:toxin ParE1/3/4